MSAAELASRYWEKQEVGKKLSALGYSLADLLMMDESLRDQARELDAGRGSILDLIHAAKKYGWKVLREEGKG